jgi:5-methylcytosine-specific restriction endonuclease McrA
MKVCTTCKVKKSFYDFYKDKRKKDGLYPRCKSCHLKCTKKYYDNNTEKIRSNYKKYYYNNQEAISKTNAKWRDNNRDRISRTSSTWAKNNLEKRRGYWQKYRSLKVNNSFEISSSEIKKLYNSDCFYCGASEDITLDHVIPLSRGGRHSIGNIVPACGKCNYSKNNKTVIEWKFKYGVQNRVS